MGKRHFKNLGFSKTFFGGMPSHLLAGYVPPFQEAIVALGA